jgi:hypothetical protein
MVEANDCNRCAGGYTSVLQVCDVGANKPLKDYIRCQFFEYAVFVVGMVKLPHYSVHFSLPAVHWPSYHSFTQLAAQTLQRLRGRRSQAA